MNIHRPMPALALLMGAAFAAPAHAADAKMFPTEEQAQQACGSDAVVWVIVDKGRYYMSTSEHYGKGDGGGYTCEKDARASYRPGQ